MRAYLKFIAFGGLFVGVQEFWVSYIWRGDLTAFLLAVSLTEPGFLTLAYGLHRRLPVRFQALALFAIMGSLGLFGIEWWLVGNTPGGSEANQLVMFATWGGAAVFALLQTDPRAPKPLQRLAFWGFALPAFTATAVALATSPTAAFALTYRVAVTLYPLMLALWAAYALYQFRAPNTVPKHSGGGGLPSGKSRD